MSSKLDHSNSGYSRAARSLKACGRNIRSGHNEDLKYCRKPDRLRQAALLAVALPRTIAKSKPQKTKREVFSAAGHQKDGISSKTNQYFVLNSLSGIRRAGLGYCSY